MSVSAYFEIKKIYSIIYSQEAISISSWVGDGPFSPNPSGDTGSVLSICVSYKPQRENSSYERMQGLVPLGKSSSQTLHQRIWNEENVSIWEGSHGHYSSATGEEHGRA